MNQTEHLGLNLPEGGEFYSVEHQNENMALLDEAVSELKTTIDKAKELLAWLGETVEDKAPKTHAHDDRYYTEFEMDSLLMGKAGISHTHAADEVGLGNVANERQYSASNPQQSVSGSSGSCTGNAATATKWQTARNINGMSVDGSANRANYGTCSTAAATAAKVVECAGFALVTGAEITVKFTVTNTAASPTLNVNGTGAKAVYYRGAAIAAGYLAANRTYTFRFNGTQYDLVGDIDTNSTYGAASATADGLVSTGAQTLAGAKTFNGVVACAGASAIGTAQARNIYAGTADMTAGTTALATGTIYVVYE